jgi:predicted HTH domain antitoxin
MSVLSEPTTVSSILVLARQLSADDRRWLATVLSRANDITLPDQATLDEAIALYLADACSLGRAAELAGVTRWDLQDRLQERGIPIVAAGDQSADEIDALAEQLEREGIL